MGCVLGVLQTQALLGDFQALCGMEAGVGTLLGGFQLWLGPQSWDVPGESWKASSLPTYSFLPLVVWEFLKFQQEHWGEGIYSPMSPNGKRGTRRILPKTPPATYRCLEGSRERGAMSLQGTEESLTSILLCSCLPCLSTGAKGVCPIF